MVIESIFLYLFQPVKSSSPLCAWPFSSFRSAHRTPGVSRRSARPADVQRVALRFLSRSDVLPSRKTNPTSPSQHTPPTLQHIFRPHNHNPRRKPCILFNKQKKKTPHYVCTSRQSQVRTATIQEIGERSERTTSPINRTVYNRNIQAEIEKRELTLRTELRIEIFETRRDKTLWHACESG